MEELIDSNLYKNINISLCIPTKDRYDNFLINYLKEYIKYLNNGIIHELIISCENGNDYNKIFDEYREILKTDKRFRIYKNNKVLGVFLNKLKVCSYAESEYIALIDSDNFADINYFNTVRKYIYNIISTFTDSTNKNSLKNSLKNSFKYSIFSPCRLKNSFDFKQFENAILTKYNVYDYKDNELFSVLLNTGNYVLTKDIINSIDFKEWNIERVSSYDVIFFNLLCFKQLDGFKIHIVKDLEYIHVLHNGSIYLEKKDFCNNYYNKYILPEYQNFKKYIVLKPSGRVGNALFRYLAYCILKIRIDKFNENKKYCDRVYYEYISELEYDMKNDYIFYKGLDLHSNDIYFENLPLDEMFLIASNNHNIKCFNTLGFFKNKFEIDILESNEYINDDNNLNDGLYLKNNIVLNDSNFLYYIENINELIGKNILLDGYFQFDYIYLKYKNEIFDVIKENKDKHYIFEDNYYGSGNNKYLLNNFFSEITMDEKKKYNFVMHLRLGDFNGRHDFIEYEYLEKILNKIKHEYSYVFNLKNVIVVEKLKSQSDYDFLNKCIIWFTNNNIPIYIESNDMMTDFYIIKNADIVLSSMSTFSWIACYLSNSLKQCFMPNYNFYNNNKFEQSVEQLVESCFKRPIENTILYDVKTTKLKNIKVIILTLKEFPDRFNKMEKLIVELSKIGLNVEIYNGVYGKDIKIYSTDKDNIKILYYNKTSIVYDTSKRINGQIMGMGELGCAWSQINIYNKLLHDNEYDQYLILEDDAFLLNNINQLKELLINLPDNYDVCHIGYSDWYPFEKLNKINDYFYNIKKKYFNRCTSYILSKTGAQTILSYHNRLEIKENYRLEYSNESVISSSTNNCITLPSDDLLCHIFLHTSNFKLYIPETPYFHIRDDNVSVIEIVNGGYIS